MATNPSILNKTPGDFVNIPNLPPGVQVTKKGVLNTPIKDIICALLFGGLNNMLKGPLLCVKVDIEKLIDMPIVADLRTELMALKNKLDSLEALNDIKNILGRVNKAVADVQSLLALNGMCPIPLKAPPIPDVLKQIIDAEFAEANAILNDLGRLLKPEMCLMGNGGMGPGGGYNPKSILGSIQSHIKNGTAIPGNQMNMLKQRLTGIGTALDKSINRQLFPDFRHKHNLTTGQSWAAGSSGVTMEAAPPIENQWNPPYPSATTPNLKDATAQAQMLVAGVHNTASYPVSVDGITNNNIWLGILGPDIYALAVDALTPQDPFFAQQEPIYDYCGKVVGYTANAISGNEKDAGGDPVIGAEVAPPPTSFNIFWISDRNCWAVNNVLSEQVVNGRKGTYLDANPTIELHRGYNHYITVPSYDHFAETSMLAPEMYICKVGANLRPLIENGSVVKFNLGLSRLETYELLEDANGIDGTEGEDRRISHESGTTLFFAAEGKMYSGSEPPSYPSESVWWTNTITCVTQKWVPTGAYDAEVDAVVLDGTGTWSEVTDQERKERWVGSSNTFGDPQVNYLAYSNKEGTVFGLLKLT